MPKGLKWLRVHKAGWATARLVGPMSPTAGAGRLRFAAIAVAIALMAAPAEAATPPDLQCIFGGSGTSPNPPGRCGSAPFTNFWDSCQDPIAAKPVYSLTDSNCDYETGPCEFTAIVAIEYPGNRFNPCNPDQFVGGGYLNYLPGTGNYLCSPEFFCDDLLNAVITESFQCPGGPSTLQLKMCPALTASCTKTKNVIIDPGDYYCAQPPTSDCGSNAARCDDCHPAGKACFVDNDGKTSCLFPAPGAHMRYRAGGAGGTSFPGTGGSLDWRATLGLYWSHDYAKRIIVAPDASHVWMITEGASFREFKALAAGTGWRPYDPAQTAPSDEYRRLYYDSAQGWKLDYEDGRVDFFRLADGQWDRTVRAQDANHPTTATYSGSPAKLQSVAFPDGRTEEFEYHASGKLRFIRELGVGGSPVRSWEYTWTGNELTGISRPDGRSLVLTYDPSRAGYLTRVELIGTDASSRIENAFAYSPQGRVVKSWRGHPVFDAVDAEGDFLAVDRMEFAYTDVTLPTQTVVTRHVSESFDRVTTHVLGRDTRSKKARVASIEGSCPTCGLSPTTVFAYTNAAHPLLPSTVTESPLTSREVVTQFTYSANGRVLTKDEVVVNADPPLARLTEYDYDDDFPGLLESVAVPSTSGSDNLRTTTMDYDDVTGALLSRTIDGYEGEDELGEPAAFPPEIATTVYTPNSSGEPIAINPPGFTTDDETSFTYTLPGRNGHVADSRTDPLTGTTAFGFDALNRRVTVTDPNGITTETRYDELGRIRLVIARAGTLDVDFVAGDAPDPADFVTEHVYSSLGDLFCTKLPRGNGFEYRYDPGGRNTEVRRGMVVAEPDAELCLDDTEARERSVYKYDGAGNRIEESLERWDGATWVSESKTTYVHSCHLDRITQGAGSPTPSVTEHCYDASDNLEKVWDANHPKVTNQNPTHLYEHDGFNRLVKHTAGPLSTSPAETVYAYDLQDHQISVTDAEGNVTSYVTSDRDLVTEELSPVSGATKYSYNEHGILTETTDARGVVTSRTVDAADRVNAVTFDPPGVPDPDPALTTTYAYGSSPALFNVGRLTGITRGGYLVDYEYDRLGRLEEDGTLRYGYDRNGNRTEVEYPSGAIATYTYDFADRQATLDYDDGSGAIPIASGASYKPAGPLTSLTLGNDLVESRSFDQRYYPSGITAGSLLDWDYTVDGSGNPKFIIGDIVGQAYAANFVYVDYLYFLEEGNGPWGLRSWTYDKIGNRLTSDGGSPATYTYVGGAHNPRLLSVSPTPGAASGSRTYIYDPDGNQISVSETDGGESLETTTYEIDAASRLSGLSTDLGPSETELLYDGRGYLREANQTASGTSDSISVTPTYSSDGLMMSRSESRVWTTGPADPEAEDSLLSVAGIDSAEVLYFAGRPVAQVEPGPTVFYLSTDHLGAPVLLTDASGDALWAGSMEPFGPLFTAGLDNPDPEPMSGSGMPGVVAQSIGRLSSEKVFLRYPGQWASDAFRVTGQQGDIYYNVHRWYEPGTGRYISPDPLKRVGAIVGLSPQFLGALREYVYVDARPTASVDPLGLDSRICCRPLLANTWLGERAVAFFGVRHCFIESNTGGSRRTWGFHNVDGVGMFADPGTDVGGDCTPWQEDVKCDDGQCFDQASRAFPSGRPYDYLAGSNLTGFNSNTFVRCVWNACRPNDGPNFPWDSAIGPGGASAPGWFSPCPR